MPGTGIGPFLAAVAGFTGGASTGVVIAAQITRAVILIATAQVVAKRAAAFDPGLQGRQLTARGSTEPYKLCYGTSVMSGPLMFPSQALGIKNRELWNGIALCAHEVAAITDVWLDNEIIINADINGGDPEGGLVTGGKFAPVAGQDVCRINKHLGKPDQPVDADLQAAWGAANWSNDHRARGVAYLVTMFTLFDKTEQLWESGEPRNIRALVQGKHVYDPRLDTSPGANPTDPSYWTANSNPILQAVDRLRGAPDLGHATGIWGLAFDPSRFDWDQVAAEADHCDELVPIPGGTQPRYKSDGVLYGTEQPVDHVASILATCGGSVTLVGDKFVLRTNRYLAPDVALSESDLLEPAGIKQTLSSGNRFNHAKGTYIDPEQDWQPAETAPNTIAGYLARDDGEYLLENFEYTMVTDRYQAQRLNMYALRDADQSLTLSTVMGWPAAVSVSGERVTLDGVVGWTDKVFTVEEWRVTETGTDDWGVAVQLREDDPGAHVDPLESEYNTLTPAGQLILAEPDAIPSEGTTPPGIPYGDAATNIILNNNTNSSGNPNDGEIQVLPGKLTLNDGNVREVTSQSVLNTPFEGAFRSADSYFYVISGGVSNASRGLTGNYGSLSDWFCAVYDRILDEWRAIDNGGGEIVFAPLANDLVVARGRKINTDAGIDELQTVVPFVTDPTATPGAGTGLAVEQHQAQLSSLGVASVTHQSRGEPILVEVRGPLIGTSPTDNTGLKNLEVRRGTTVLDTLTVQVNYEDLGGLWQWTANIGGSALITLTDTPGTGTFDFNTTWDGDNMTQPPTLSTREEYQV